VWVVVSGSSGRFPHFITVAWREPSLIRRYEGEGGQRKNPGWFPSLVLAVARARPGDLQVGSMTRDTLSHGSEV